MGDYGLGFYFVGMVAMLALASTPLLAWADAPPSPTPGRLRTLDGLRGVLALGVFFHHAAVYRLLLAEGRWAVPPSRFYANLGPAAVAMFFMITGYLFWSRLIHARVDWRELYIGRLFRIGPLYLVMFVAMCALAVAHTGGPHPAMLDLGSLALWAALGFTRGGQINGYADPGLLVAGVTWTLHYEWLFYLALFPLGFLASRRHFAAAIVAAGVALGCLAVFRSLDAVCASLFALGMVSASLQRARVASPKPSVATSILVLALVAGAIAGFRTAYAPGAILLLAAAFHLIVCGSTVFGLLTSRAAVRLGDVSFGVYLLQGLVLTILFGGTPLADLALRSPGAHWAMMTLAGAVLVLIATASHVLVERPGVALGKRLARAGRRRALPAAT